MITDIDACWNRYFGEVWRELIDKVPGLGGFLIMKKEGIYKADKNAYMFLGLEEGADVEAFAAAVSAALKKGVGASATFRVIADDEAVEAGFMCYEMHGRKYSDARVFSKLLDENLFIYNFQPIVNAHTGEITAYEALMRTAPSIGLNPLQVLEMAESFDRLYDIEVATFSNTLESLKNHKDIFKNRLLFINSVTGYLLSDEDYLKLRSRYQDVMDKVVVELTEQTQIPDEILEKLKGRLKQDRMQLAVDDYGTGYSNTSNLLRYNPCVVKIDRSLISGIEINQKMQKMVETIVEFLHTSGYLALAEGVENIAELRCVIGLGVDLIQGFYLAKPSPVLLERLDDSKIKDIQIINMETTSNVQRVYHPVYGERVDVCRLVSEKYTDVLVGVRAVSFVGDKEHAVSLNIRVKDNIACSMTIEDTCLSSPNAEPVLAIGEACDISLTLSGHNRFEKKGIQVPKTSSLCINGSGELTVASESKKCYGIGNDPEHSHGRINIELDGRLSVLVNGEECVGIGSGKNIRSNLIQIEKGNIEVVCSGGSCVGIGTFNGPTRVKADECSLKIKLTCAQAVGVGSLSGAADIDLEGSVVSITGSGSSQMGIGVLSDGEGSLKLHGLDVSADFRGVRLTCVGAFDGKVDCEVSNSKLEFYCEGASVCGVGDLTGSGDVTISDSGVDMKLITSNGLDMGSPGGELVMNNVLSNCKVNP